MINKTNKGIFIPIYHLKYLLAFEMAIYRGDVKYIRSVVVLLKVVSLMLMSVLFSSIINHLTGFDIFANSAFPVFLRLLLAYIIFTVIAYLTNKEMENNI